MEGRPIRATELKDGRRVVLVVGSIHGNETAGMRVTSALEATPGVDLWVVPTLNPDGVHARTRGNAHGVDLNRNFSAGWRASPEPSGPRPFSEPETRAARSLILRIRPAVTIWFHQPQNVVRAWGPSVRSARTFARRAGMRFRALPWPHGAATAWQNTRFRRAASFVVELPAGALTRARAAALARAIALHASGRSR